MKLLEELQNLGIERKVWDQPLFCEEEKESVKMGEEEKKVSEADFLFFQNVECPCCLKKFGTKRIKAKSLRMKTQAVDLRAEYYDIEPLKYQNVMCPYCGYTAYSHFFKSLTVKQKARVEKLNLKQVLSSKLIEKQEELILEKESGKIYPISYEEALLQYKLAILCCMAKGATDLEKGLTCLKLVWLFETNGCTSGEEYTEACTNALKGLEGAFYSNYLNESILNDVTCQFLIAGLYDRLGNYQEALRLLSHLIVSPYISSKIKDKARDYRDFIKEKDKKQ